MEPPTEEQGMCIDQQLMGTMFLDACPTGYNSDDVSPVHSHRHELIQYRTDIKHLENGILLSQNIGTMHAGV